MKEAPKLSYPIVKISLLNVVLYKWECHIPSLCFKYIEVAI